MNHHPSIAIVGASGAVGRAMLDCLVDRKFPYRSLRLLASSRSAGQSIQAGDKTYTIEELGERSFEEIDIAFFAAGGGISERYAPLAAQAGALVIDNSSAFRMDEAVPLVVPEINPQALSHIPKGIIANPNCTTIIALMALYPLHVAYGLRSIIASSYQAVSGSGQSGIAELENQMDCLVKTGNVPSSLIQTYPRQIVANVIPQVDSFTEDFYTKEELKMGNESRKILSLPDLSVTCTCVRVPVYRSHAVSLSAQFDKTPDIAEAQELFSHYPGIHLKDDPSQGVYPVPLDTTCQDDCLVGRLRRDKVLDNGLALWVVGDQVLKGAALNAVQIAECLLG